MVSLFHAFICQKGSTIVFSISGGKQTNKLIWMLEYLYVYMHVCVILYESLNVSGVFGSDFSSRHMCEVEG